jgi:hypothetical protein
MKGNVMSDTATTQSHEANASMPPPVKKIKVLTLAQEQLVREFTESYEIDREQISFAGEDLYPIFDFDALSTLSLVLSDIPSISVEPGDFNPAVGLATAICKVTLKDGRSREVYGHAMVGEEIYDGTRVADLGAAMIMARSRALRTGLRSVSFDPVRAHRQQSTKSSAETFTDQRTKLLARAHMLGNQLGYIVGDNKIAWRNQINAYFKGKTSSADLDDLELSQWVGMLDGWMKARERVRNEEASSHLLKNN